MGMLFPVVCAYEGATKGNEGRQAIPSQVGALLAVSIPCRFLEIEILRLRGDQGAMGLFLSADERRRIGSRNAALCDRFRHSRLADQRDRFSYIQLHPRRSIGGFNRIVYRASSARAAERQGLHIICRRCGCVTGNDMAQEKQHQQEEADPEYMAEWVQGERRRVKIEPIGVTLRQTWRGDRQPQRSEVPVAQLPSGGLIWG